MTTKNRRARNPNQIERAMRVNLWLQYVVFITTVSAIVAVCAVVGKLIEAV